MKYSVGDHVRITWHNDYESPVAPSWITDDAVITAITDDEITVKLDHPDKVSTFEDDYPTAERFFDPGLIIFSEIDDQSTPFMTNRSAFPGNYLAP